MSTNTTGASRWEAQENKDGHFWATGNNASLVIGMVLFPMLIITAVVCLGMLFKFRRRVQTASADEERGNQLGRPSSGPLIASSIAARDYGTNSGSPPGPHSGNANRAPSAENRPVFKPTPPVACLGSPSHMNSSIPGSSTLNSDIASHVSTATTSTLVCPTRVKAFAMPMTNDEPGFDSAYLSDLLGVDIPRFTSMSFTDYPPPADESASSACEPTSSADNHNWQAPAVANATVYELKPLANRFDRVSQLRVEIIMPLEGGGERRILLHHPAVKEKDQNQPPLVIPDWMKGKRV
ncbi:hypothetical protein B0J12DRAFT_745301 [Macrophomina phaseolina]|uniref:Uncharacterized protein n=1 Tax=Macrophomina phaseolina TaxID=35725 RepID=A0ABQ8FVL5_9PEZI|nr:hypothetical protein B0J12DRAFT_745301 [Macrophomina phaseolina]